MSRNEVSIPVRAFRLRAARRARSVGDPEISLGEQALERNTRGSKVRRGSFFAVDRADHAHDLGPEFAQHHYRLKRLSAGGRDVFEHDNPVALVQLTLELLGGAVVLLAVADENAGLASLKAGGGDQGNPAQLGPGEAVDRAGLTLDRPDSLGEHLGDLLQDLGPCAEAIFVEVVAARATRTEGERASQE